MKASRLRSIGGKDSLGEFKASDAVQLLEQLTTILKSLPPDLDASMFFDSFSTYVIKYAPNSALITFAEAAAAEMKKRKERIENAQRMANQQTN